MNGSSTGDDRVLPGGGGLLFSLSAGALPCGLGALQEYASRGGSMRPPDGPWPWESMGPGPRSVGAPLRRAAGWRRVARFRPSARVLVPRAHATRRASREPNLTGFGADSVHPARGASRTGSRGVNRVSCALPARIGRTLVVAHGDERQWRMLADRPSAMLVTIRARTASFGRRQGRRAGAVSTRAHAPDRASERPGAT